ncbi:hypothetical protein F2Q69_00010463 [Brassica cretica]|uniref:DUF642 domain-containing protein n=1 Tax=Brassica cretica TaxID=69181 RepID=A0A8S9QUF7_BRACR|nr:hypothetical protein F2Q69_00010463 [Brassica cretica]
MLLYHTCVLLVFFSLCHGFHFLTFPPPRDPDLDGLLSNGLFEKTSLTSEMKGRQIIGTDNLSDWQISGYVELINSDEPPPGGFNFSLAFGSNAVRLGNSGLISQEVSVKRGLVYSLTFGATRSCAQNMNIKVSVSGLSDNIPIQTMFSSDGGDSYAWLSGQCPMWVKNGRFDIGPYVFAKYSTGVLIPSNSQEDSISPFREWFVESPKSVKYIANSSFELSTTLLAVELMGGRESAISQVINTEAGGEYFLRFWVGDAHNDCHGSMMVKAFVEQLPTQRCLLS